ncbi:hypothetical protein PG993_008468 [Apiospora rasikravindrae]|uniref:Wax synthase domain-containing protein n=1 Tax=Apiospora rasikravindrae TaxID=990691 RepID=A0ABR1T0S0_9PEZI
MSSLTVHIFPLISVFGLYAVSSYLTHSGLAAAFAESQTRDGAMRLLPDGRTPVLTSYTGLAPLDSYLANLQYIFVPVVDGSSPDLSLLGWHWGNLLLPLFTVMLGESLRTGRARDLVFFEFWGLAIQYCGYFVTMPIYCYVYLLSSSSQSQATTTWRVSATAARIIPISMILGYVLPTVIMSLSHLHSGQSRQVAVAVWQNFPAWVATLQWALMWCTSSMPTPDAPSSKPNSSSPNRAFSNTVSHIYRAVALISGLVHVAGLVPVVLATVCPEQLISLSPVQLDESTRQSLQAGNFFLPPKWDGPVRISSMAEGAGNFLRYDYYIGTAAALLWAAMVRASRRSKTNNGQEAHSGNGGWSAGTGVTQGLMMALTTVVLGPGFTIASLMI